MNNYFMFLKNARTTISIVYKAEINSPVLYLCCHCTTVPFWAVTFGLSPVFPQKHQI